MRILRIPSCRAWLSCLMFFSLPAAVGAAEPGEDPAFGEQPVAVNQVGYVTERPKRFTAPLAPDGSRFAIRLAEGGAPLFRGEIEEGIGDFSSFRPEDSKRHYVVLVESEGGKNGVSDPFLIRSGLLQEEFW